MIEMNGASELSRDGHGVVSTNRPPGAFSLKLLPPVDPKSRSPGRLLVACVLFVHQTLFLARLHLSKATIHNNCWPLLRLLIAILSTLCSLYRLLAPSSHSHMKSV